MKLSAVALFATIALALIGCSPPEVIYPDKAPQPVSVMRLTPSVPTSGRLFAGSVRSWKTEDITFEVNGRVRWVVEPGTEIEGRTYNVDGTIQSPGTQIAQLDDERYQIAVDSAQTEIEIAVLKRDSVQVQIDSVLPAQIASAKAALDLAKIEYQRNQRLVQQRAGAQKNLDKARASLDAAKADLDNINAQLEQTKAELKSANAAIVQAKQAFRDAQRNLDDTKLYSSFRGQVADTFVVPGSVVSAQTAVASFQMMNPMKVELEVSAELSRRLQLSETIPLSITTPGNQKLTVNATVYAISPSADNATRTFTVTLLVGNRKVEAEMPESLAGKPIAHAEYLWRVDLDILPEAPKKTWYMPETGLHQDNRGDFVWKVLNLKIDEPTKRALKVEKLYVIPGKKSIPFLGQMRFRTVDILPGQAFNPKTDLFASNVRPETGDANSWQGEDLLLDDRGRWLLRPGDVVSVDLEPQSQSLGFFVPIDAIHEESGQTSIYVIQKKDDKTVAKQVGVKVITTAQTQASSLQQIEPLAPEDTLQDAQVVLEGVHYLVDREPVSVVSNTGEQP